MHLVIKSGVLLPLLEPKGPNKTRGEEMNIVRLAQNEVLFSFLLENLKPEGNYCLVEFSSTN